MQSFQRSTTADADADADADDHDDCDNIDVEST